MKRKNLAPLIISLFLLSACSFFSSQKPTDVSDKSADAVTDEATLQGLQLRPLSCEMLKDAGMKEVCLEEVNQAIAQVLQSEILHTFNIARCDELEGYNSEGCRERIQTSGVTGIITLAEYDTVRQALVPVQPENFDEGEEVLESELYDLARCDAVASSLKAYCRNQMTQQIQEILMFEIIESEDSNRCAELTVQEFKNQCEQEFGIFVEPEQANPDDAAADAIPASAGEPVDDAAMDAEPSADAEPAGAVFPFQKTASDGADAE